MTLRKQPLLVAGPLMVAIASLFPISSYGQSADSARVSAESGLSPTSNGSGSSTVRVEPVKAQTPNGTEKLAVLPQADSRISGPSRIAVGVKMSLLGVGIEVATPVTQKSNLRVGFNFFDYSRGYDKDGISYAGKLNFRSLETHYDWFPFGGGFHLSPGVLLYNGMKVSANASVPGGTGFSLGGYDYYSDPNNPVTGTGKLAFNRVAPTLLLGFGNLLPRSGRHFAVPFEIGVAYMGSPKSTLNLTGSACDSLTLTCNDVATDPSIQENIQSEQAKVNNSISAFKFYPVISLGMAYNFGRRY